jgi:hypothetical protein
MTGRVPSLIDAIANESDAAVQARMLRAGAENLLANPSDITAVADAVLECGETDTTRAAEMLLAAALDEARMGTENGTPEGSVLMETLAEAMSARDAAEPLLPVQRLRLSQCYARAGLTPPPFALLSPEAMTESAPAETPDLDALLGPLMEEIGDNSLQIHAALSELLAGLPLDPAAYLVSMIVARPGTMEARLGLHWLLDPRPAVRLAAATALMTRAMAGTLADVFANLLPGIRKVMPADPARDALDGVIRSQMGRNTAASPTVKIHRAAGSLPDGAGAQNLVAGVQIGSRRVVAIAMLKQGHGLKDAFIVPCNSATEQKRIFAHATDEIETFDLPSETLTALLALSLGEGAAMGRMPAPGLVDLLELFGSQSLTPRASGTPDILDSLGAKQVLEELPAAQRKTLMQASDALISRFEHADSWFEDTRDLRDAIARARSDTGRAEAVWTHLSTRRAWWARHFALCAAVLKSADVPSDLWLTCADVALTLLGEGTLKRIPVMAAIVEMTLAADAARNRGFRPNDSANQQIDIRSMLATEGIPPAMLEGYLTALVIAPHEPTPEAWLMPLIGGIEFQGEGSLDRVLKLIQADIDQIDDATGNAKVSASRLAALDDDAFCDWASGFSDLVEATPKCWSGRQLAADDKRVLRMIAEVADGANGSALRAILPAWLAQRHAQLG